MRKEYTKTSPDHLYLQRSNYHSPYLSPKNQPPSFTSFKSPSQQEDLQQKYPVSYKYNMGVSSKQEARSPQNYHSPQHNSAIEISQLKLTISQLRNSLQVCSQNSQRMQEELFLQRSKNIELSEVRRRMEDEFKRMEFQLDRITNYEALEARESSIKLESAVRENTRLSMQVGDLIEEVKSLKMEHRKLMSQCDLLLQQKQTLLRENECLLQKLQSLEGEVKAVKREVAQQSLHIKSDNNIPSRVNNMHTVRTNQASTIIGNSPRNIASRQSIDLEQLPQEVDYEEQNKKLLEDYKRLIEENESMKQLYNNFYKNDSSDPIEKVVNLQQDASNFQQSFSNRMIVQQMKSSPPPKETELMLKTMQKQELISQITQVRQAAINELMKMYHKTVDKSKAEHKNCLKLFIHQLTKNKTIYSQMAENYLEIRSTIEEEAGIKVPHKIEEISVKGDKQAMILQIYKSVKQKAKGEKETGVSLAIFRLLTLISKCQFSDQLLLENIKHSVLKYLYKLGSRQRMHTQQN